MFEHRLSWVLLLLGCCLLTAAGPLSATAKSVPPESPVTVSKLELTPKEQAWLDAHPVIRISGPKSFPPFHYFEPDGRLRGMALDYMLALSEMIGFKVEIQENLVWPEVLRRIRTHDLDVISCLAHAADRESYISFSEPYLSYPLVIVTRRDYEFIGGQNDLHHQRVACVRGNVSCKWLSREGVKYMDYPVATPSEALDAVSLGRADAYLGNLAAVTYQIEEKGLANLKIAAPTDFGHYNLHIGVRKDWPELVQLLNRALANLQPQQHIAFQNRWMRVEYDYGVKVSDVIWWGLATAGIVLFIMVGFAFWNRRLTRGIGLRESAVVDLKLEKDFSDAVLRWVYSIVVVCDPKGYMVVFNNNAEECSEYLFSEVKDRPFWEILNLPEEQDFIRQGFEKVLTERTTAMVTNFWLTKSGGRRLIEWRNSPLMNPDGSIGFVLSTGRDVTEQREIEESGRFDRERLALALEATGASIWEWNIKTDKLEMGPEIIKSMGYERNELELTPEGMSRLVDPSTLSEFEKLLDFHNRNRSHAHTIEYKFKAKSGEWRWLRSNTRIYREDEKGQPEVLIGSLLDVTESKKTQELIVQTEKMLSVGGLAAGMAHELNNPLGAILMGSQNIVRRLSPELEKNRKIAGKHGIDLNGLQHYLEEQKILRAFDGIKDAGMRAAGIISNMLQFSRSSSSQFNSVGLTRLVMNALELAGNDFNLKKQLDFKQVDVVKEFEDELLEVSCTETEIKQVILILIINAFQAMTAENSDKPKRLILRTSRENGFAHIEIEDNGPGMDESIQKRIFEPFFTTKPAGYGTGLGLSVAYTIITNNHKGSIEVDSAPGKGTRFTICLPIENNI